MMKKTALALVALVILASCSGDDSDPTGTDAPEPTDAPEQTQAPVATDATDAGAADGVLSVPEEFDTIQDAVDAA